MWTRSERIVASTLFQSLHHRSLIRPRPQSTITTADAAISSISRLSRLIDVDANICHPQLIPQRDEHLQRAVAAGVQAMVVPASSLGSAREILDFCHAHGTSMPRILTTAGIHPYEATEKTVQDLPTTMAEIRTLIAQNSNNIAAVGECGLDFSDGFPPREYQLQVFRAQVVLAAEMRKPLFLHVREAFEECFGVLDDAQVKIGALPPIIVHCFTGNEEDLRHCVERGYSLSFSGMICRNNAAGKELCQSIRRIFGKNNDDDDDDGDDRRKQLRDQLIMVETDAPYLGFPHCRAGYTKGAKKQTPNVPSSLPKVVEKLAAVLNEDVHHVGTTTREAAIRFFGFQLDKKGR